MSSKICQEVKSTLPATPVRSPGQSLYLPTFLFSNVVLYVFSDKLIYHIYLILRHVFIFHVAH